eukprot:6224227-Pyramimonas_sp.AAC.1
MRAVGLQWSSLRGHETCGGCAEVGVADACGRLHWGLRRSALWRHDRVRGVPKCVWLAHAGGDIGAFAGAPDACGRLHWGLRWGCLWGHQ